jgi:hypothetical protein
VEDVGASGPLRDGKAPTRPSSEVQSVVEPRGFMVDARRVMRAHAPLAAEEGWQVVNRSK